MPVSTTHSRLLTRWFAAVAIAMLSLGATLQAQSNSRTDPLGLLKADAIETPTSQQAMDQETGTTSLAKIKQSVEQQPQGLDSSPPQQSSDTPIYQKRIDSIQDRISLFKKLVEKRNVALAEEEAKQQSQTDPAQFPPKIEIEPLTEPELDSTKPEDPGEAAQPPQISGTPVVAQPINPFKLASSLFLTGNIEASRRSYEAGLKNATPEEQLWLKCFIGCCFRLQGDLANAESTFREVTNDRSAAYPVDYAKWCLKYLDQRRNSLEQFRQIEAEIDNILNVSGKK